MRDLEFQLSKKDLLRIMLDARLKKNGTKESTKLIITFLIAVVSLGYTILRIKIAEGPFLVFWLIGDLFAGLGVWFGAALVLIVPIGVFRFYKMLKSPLVQKQLVRFEEHRIEVREENGTVNCDPYAAIVFTEKTKHGIMIYIKRSGNVKTLLFLPGSAFTGDREKEFCIDFLQQKQQEKAEMDPLKQQAEISSFQEEIFKFAFIQEEAEWIDALKTQKYYLTHSKYVFRMPEGIIMILLILIIAGIGIGTYFKERNLFVMVSYCIVIILILLISYQTQFSKQAALRNARLTAKKGFPVPRRTGRQVIAFSRSGLYYSSDSEQWNVTYDRIITVVKASREVFLFIKGGQFLNIPVWAFQSEGEEQQALDFLKSKGIPVNRKEITF